MNAVVQQIACPACGKGIPQYTERPIILRCPACRVLVDAVSKKQIDQKGWKTTAQKMSALRIGLRGTVFGVDVRVVGWVKYSGEDDEDTWYWEEWHLKGKDRSFWLEFHPDEDTFTMYQLIEIEQPLPKKFSHSQRVVIGGMDTFTVQEIDTATLEDFDGEMDWIPVKGEKMAYVDGRSGSVRYSIEDYDTEPLVFKGRSVSPMQIAEGFGLADVQQSILFANEEKKRATWYAIGCLLLSIGLFVASFFVYQSRSVLFSRSTPVQCFPSPANDMSCASYTFGPVNVQNGIGIYEIVLRATEPSLSPTAVFEVQMKTEADVFLSSSTSSRNLYPGVARASVSKFIHPRLSGEYYISVTPSSTRAFVSKGALIDVDVVRYPVRPIYPLLAAVLSLIAAMLLFPPIREHLIGIILTIAAILFSLFIDS